MDTHAATAANRLLLADFFDRLDEDQLRARSLCADWTVRDVLGHLAMPLTGTTGGLLRHVLRSRGSVDRGNGAYARELSLRPCSELTAVLRDKAYEVVKAPGVGPMGQMADGCIHLRDCARPLGLADDVCVEHWRMVLDWAAGGVRGLVPRPRLIGLRLTATDQDWSHGSGEPITGSSEALAMAVAGRAAALADLSGPGVALLGGRLRS